MRRVQLMGTILLLLLILGLSASAAVSNPPPQGPEPPTPTPALPTEVRLSAKDDGRQTELNEGQLLLISLEGNPSTGYMWEVEEGSEKIIRQVGEIEFHSESDLLGAPGKQIMRFQAVGPGQTTLKLVYHRPWEKGVEPAKTFSIQVEAVGPFTGVDSSPTTPEARSAVESAVSLDEQPQLGLPSSFNWCDEGGCTLVKDQGNCGSCWAFATVGPLESKIKLQDGVEKDLSEQYLLSCNTDDWDCDGGWWAHDYHWNEIPSGESDAGAVYEVDFPYVASQVACGPPHTHHEKIDSWAFVGPEYGIPSVADIKQAIYNHGPVSVAVCVGSAFQSYVTGVFETDEWWACPLYDVNHAVVLVGWDDDPGVWILRNSWGTGWGESGYMRIGYGISNVGYSANYIVYPPIVRPNKVYLPLVTKNYPLSGPTPGFWESDYEEFYVTTDRAYVDNFAVYIYVLGCGYYKVIHTPLEPITNNQFSFSGPLYASGTFHSATTASGTDGLDSLYIPGCGYVNGGPWSWSATWQNDSQPGFMPAEVVEADHVEPVETTRNFYRFVPVK